MVRLWALLILLILALLWLYRRLNRRPPQGGDAADTATPQVQPLKRCAICRRDVPENLGITAQGVFYCSTEHWQADQSK